MARILPRRRVRGWFAGFLPRLARGEPATLFTPATVSDRSDGKIAHLDGLNFSRAWCWKAIAPLLEPRGAERAQRGGAAPFRRRAAARRGRLCRRALAGELRPARGAGRS